MVNKMKYAIDRIEENIAILEDINTKEKIEINITELPKGIKEGSILVFKDNKYIIDEKEEENRRKIILEKFNKLKRNSKY